VPNSGSEQLLVTVSARVSATSSKLRGAGGGYDAVLKSFVRVSNTGPVNRLTGTTW
jgi:hypothetical protein